MCRKDRTKKLKSPPIFISLTRTLDYHKQQENIRIQIEANRLQAAMMMKEARILADNDDLKMAVLYLRRAENMLENVNINDSVIYILKDEVQELLRLMQSHEIYRSIGRPFALSSEISHERQRFAERGDTEKLRLFPTPRMDEYHQQAKSFPSKPIPTKSEDLKKEQAEKYFSACFGSLSSWIKRAIHDLRSVDSVIYRN